MAVPPAASIASSARSAHPAHHPLAGIGLALAATFFFSILDTTTKTVVTAVPLLMAVWVRYVVQAVLSTAILLPAQGPALWRAARPGLQVLRGLMLLTSTLFAFSSLAYIPVGEFTAIVMITPLAVTLVAATWLKEQVSALRWILIALGFAGALLIIQPGGANFHWSWLMPLGVVASNTVFQVLTGVLARHDSPSTTHFYTGWVATAVASLVLPLFWAQVPDWSLWLRMLFMGTMGATGHYLLTLSYARAPAATLTPFMYAQIGWSMLMGWLAFHHVPDSLGVAGMLVIAASGVSCAWLTAHESRRAPN